MCGENLESDDKESAESAHPRVCGENRESPVQGRNLWGSSPRVRGKHETSTFDIELPGLIPACAGKTN